MQNGIRTRYASLPIAFLFILLSSCSHVSKQDGPPNFYIDETKIPNAVPKHEPLAKYGNMPSYVVFGKRYYTMKSCKNYEAVGTASWYGTKFHAHRTSSGEPYSLAGMTAAHTTLPLPTYVEVTNLKNQRSVIVKVNDRGPFESNRLIDLSYVAAKKLGMLGHGTTKVKIRVITPDTYRSPSPTQFAETNANAYDIPAINQHLSSNSQHPNYRYQENHSWAKSNAPSSMYLQVGAFRDRSRAEKYQQQLNRLLAAPVQIFRTNSGQLFQVKVGPLKDVAARNRVSVKLKQLGISSTHTQGA